MKKIEGNKDLILKVKGNYEKNEIGENVPILSDYKTLKKGFLDMSNTNTSHTTYNAKVQDSTHYFICNYEELSTFIDNKNQKRKPNIDELVAFCDDKQYDVLWIDNVMELNEQYEIYLRFVGVK